MAAVTAQQTRKEEDIETVQPKTVNTLTLLSLKRTYDLFIGNRYQKVPIDEDRCVNLRVYGCHALTLPPQPKSQNRMQGTVQPTVLLYPHV